MNASINVLKVIFASAIALMHCGTFFGYDAFEWFQGSFIYVEWFYIFAGYTLVRKVNRMNRDLPICETSAGVIKDRILSLLPFYFLSCTIALVVKLITRQIVVSDPWHIHMIVFEYLMLQMTTLQVHPLTDVSWFLSSMWLALIILVPLLLYFRRRFSKAAILITIALYLHIAVRTGVIYNPIQWLPLSYKGNLRALAAICLGMSSYELGEIIRPKLKRPLLEDSVVLVLYAGIFVYTFFWEETVLTNTIYFIIPFVFTGLIAVQMSKQKKSLIPDNRFTRFLGKFSMVLFMNHAYIIKTVQALKPDLPIPQRVLLAMVFACVTSLIVYFVGNILLSGVHKLRQLLDSRLAQT